jgi:hypothetical protein
MLRKFLVVCTLAAQLSEPIAHAQGANQLKIQAETTEFASLSNFKQGYRRISDGSQLPELSFELSVTAMPPCSNLAIYFDLLSPSGAYMARDLMAAGTVDELRNVRKGSTYVAHIVNRNLTSAGSIVIRPKCSSIR